MKKHLFIFITAILCFNMDPVIGQNALHFDGGNDLVQTSFPGVAGANGRTFEAWIYVEPGAPPSNLCIMDYGLNAVGSRNTFAVGGNRNLTFISGGTNANISAPAATITEGEWTHVAFVLDNGVGFLYKNGVQVMTGSLSTVNTPTGNQNLIIGERVNGGSIPFQGIIDELRVWNVARTAQEIQNDTINEFCSVPSGLVAYYKFNQGIAGGNNSGVSVLNEEVASNDGVLTGFALSGNTSNWVNGQSLLPPQPVMDNDTIIACGSYTTSNGIVLTSTGIYTDTIINASGCDTIVRLDLTILNQSTGTLNTTVCDSVVSPSGNYVYYSTGVYFDTIPNAVGCDSIITVNVTVPVIDDSVSVNGNDLTAVQAGANYQWYICMGGFVPISGAVSQTYTIPSTANYAVSIDISGCIDTSDCILAFISGFEGDAFQNIGVYPNPSHGELFIEGFSEGNLSIVDAKGVLIFERVLDGRFDQSLILPEFIKNGLYFVQLQNDELNIRKKIFIQKE